MFNLVGNESDMILSDSANIQYNNTAMEVKFKGYSFVKGEYRTTIDAKAAYEYTDEEFLAAKGKRKSLYVRTWFGNEELVEFSISDVEITKFSDVIYTIASDKKVPERFFATPSDILRDTDIVYPVSYSRIKD